MSNHPTKQTTNPMRHLDPVGTGASPALEPFPDTPTTERIVWCPKGPDGDLRLSMIGATMWLAWGKLEGSSGDDLAGLQKRGWRVVQVRVQEIT